MEPITCKKEDNFENWYQQILIRCDLIEYYDIPGCYIFKADTMEIWENIQIYLNQEFKKLGVKNMYFPLFVKKENLEKESNHIKGFTPEVAWIKTSDKTEDNTIAIRPTSETIIYSQAKKWIRSYRDLPIKINQWCNVVRWEFKDPTPFIRSKEFLWQEGHTFHQYKLNADQEVRNILNIYKKLYEEVLLVPVIPGIKSESEKFCGADYTTTVETYIPECSKAIQAATSHSLGQNFSKIFDLTFRDENNTDNNYVWQNSWGLSTRSIGIIIMIHGDNKGCLFPPKIAPIQIIITTKEDKIKNKEAFEIYLNTIRHELSMYRLYFDRTDQTMGYKFNYWEQKGVPIRIEIGSNEFISNNLSLFRRDTFEKIKNIPKENLAAIVRDLFRNIEENMYTKAKEKIFSKMLYVDDMNKFIENIDGHIIKVFWCGKKDCEDEIYKQTKDSKGISIRNLCIPFDEKEQTNMKCIVCNQEIKRKYNCVSLFSKSF